MRLLRVLVSEKVGEGGRKGGRRRQLREREEQETDLRAEEEEGAKTEKRKGESISKLSQDKNDDLLM